MVKSRISRISRMTRKRGGFFGKLFEGFKGPITSMIIAPETVRSTVPNNPFVFENKQYEKSTQPGLQPRFIASTPSRVVAPQAPMALSPNPTMESAPILTPRFPGVSRVAGLNRFGTTISRKMGGKRKTFKGRKGHKASRKH